MTCKMCEGRGKTWAGDDPRCAFNGAEFSEENWNCATVNAIRDLCPRFGEVPAGVLKEYCEDQWYATINTSEIEEFGAYCLWLTWYKGRGRTEAMWLLASDVSPRKPTEDDLLAVIDHYKAKALSQE